MYGFSLCRYNAKNRKSKKLQQERKKRRKMEDAATGKKSWVDNTLGVADGGNVHVHGNMVLNQGP